MTPVAFVLAAALGAIARHEVNRAGWAWRGTLAVNVTGSFALGVLTALDPSAATMTVLGTGLCGAFTTFSTFALDAVESDTRHGVTVVGASLVLGIGAAVAGHAIV